MITGGEAKLSPGQRATKPGRKKSSTALGAKLKKSATALGVKLSKKPVDNLMFCRYELKYRIDEAKAAAIEQFLRPYLHLDRYTQIQQTRAYPIVSMYLDSEDFKLCQETMTGKKSRFKLRIRSYDDDPKKPRFFEIKRRANNVIIKSRVRATADDTENFLLGRSLLKRDYEKDEQVLRQFQLYVNYLNAKPSVLVRYMRRAYEGDSDNRVRVTFDRQLCYRVADEPKVLFNGYGWHKVNIGHVILELKFTARYPAWLGRMVKYFNLNQQSMSKYVASVKQSTLHRFPKPPFYGQNIGV